MKLYPAEEIIMIVNALGEGIKQGCDEPEVTKGLENVSDDYKTGIKIGVEMGVESMKQGVNTALNMLDLKETH